MNREHDTASDIPEGQWNALARYLAGESPPDEAEYVRQWLQREPGRRALIEALDRSMAGLEKPVPDVDVDAAWRRVSDRLDGADVVPIGRARRSARTPPRWRSAALRIAAGVTVAVGAAALYTVTRNDAATSVPASLASWDTGTGQVEEIRLPDGSRVVLGPRSRVALGDGFGSDARVVELDGIAQFDVVHNAASPFTVRAGDASIRDLGTVFTVRTDAGGVSVAVTDGSVVLERADGTGTGIDLAAGDRGVLEASGRVSAARSAVTAGDTAWTRGLLDFDNASLDRVAADLARWYGIRLVVDEGLADRRLTVAFEDETADRILEIIGMSLPALLDRRADTAWLRMDSTRTR